MISLDCHEQRALFITVKLVAAEMAMVIGDRDDNNLLLQQNGDGTSLHTYLLMLTWRAAAQGRIIISNARRKMLLFAVVT
jgi:hypothetical protein